MSRPLLVLPVLTAASLLVTPPATAGVAAASLVPGDGAVTVSWPALAGADSYRVTRDGAVVATLPGGATSWADTGLANGTPHRYEVTGLSGATSTVVAPATATTAVDLDPPALEGRVGLRMLHGGVVVYWRASGDVTDTAQYRLSVDGEVAGTSATTAASGTFSVTGLTGGLQDLVLEAVDRAGNATRLWQGQAAARDVEPPAVPVQLHVDACTSDSATLSWSAMGGGSSGDLAVRYQVRRDDAPVATTTETRRTLTGLTAGVPTEFTVSAVDAAGNTSPESHVVEVTPLATAPTTKGLSATASCSITTPDRLPPPAAPALWMAGDGDVDEVGRAAAVALLRVADGDSRRYGGYRLYVDDRLVRTGVLGAGSSCTAIPLEGAGSRPRISVEAVDLFGQASPRVSLAPAVVDGTVPVVPTGLTASVHADRSATVTWEPSARATGYQVELDGRPQPLTGATTLTLPPTQGPQVRTVRVSAVDAQGRASLPSVPLFVTS